MRSLRKYRLIVGCILATLALLQWVPRVWAAEVASTNARDSIRCEMGGHNVAGKIRVDGFCYYSISPVGGEASLTVAIRSMAGTDWNVSTTFGDNCLHFLPEWVGTHYTVGSMGPTGWACTFEIGPQTTSDGYVLPAGALRYRTTASTYNWQTWMSNGGSYDTPGFMTNTGCTAGRWGTVHNAYCIGYWYGSDNAATNAGMDAAVPFSKLDHFPGGTAYGVAPPFCGAFAEVTDPASPTALLYEGDEVEISWNRTGGVTDLIQVTWEIRGLERPEEATWYTVSGPGAIGTSGVTSMTVMDQAVPAPGGQYAGKVLFRCRAMDDDAWQYKRSEDASEDLAAANRPCAKTSIVWPQIENISAGDVATWNLYHVSVGYTGDPDVLVEYATWDDANLDGPGALEALTWSTLADLSPGERGSFDAEAGYDGTTRQFVLRCTDDVGVYYAGQWSTANRRYDPDATGTEEGCYAQSGIGLRPSSWVPGLWRMGSCTITVLFVPSDPSGWLDENVAMLSEDAPFSFVADTVSFFDAATDPAGPSTSGCLGDFGIGTAAESPVCFRTAATDAMLDSQPWIRPFIWFAVVGLTILGFVLSTFRMFAP